METTGRFAPSPSGRLHLGNLLCALLVWLSARQKGGRVLLRVEDLDTARCPRRYAAQMEADLRWLGLDWDREMPLQSTRTPVYAEQFERLRKRGLIYPCFCTRNELHAASAPHASDGTLLYAGTCRNLTPAQIASQTRKPAWRIRVPEETISFRDGVFGAVTQNLATACGDFILRRSDGVFAYQLAVSVDDLDMGITRVVRARDLLDSTPRQIWLMGTLGGKAPEYAHAPLLVAPDGRKLSKREGDLNMEALRQKYTPEQLTGKLAKLAGLRPTDAPVTAIELAADFSWDKVPRADIPIPPDF